MAKEAQHERVCTFLVAGDKTPTSSNEIRVALESSDDDAKVDAMEKAISALLAGEQLPMLFITIVRYVLPSENHTVQRLLLLYLVCGLRVWGVVVRRPPGGGRGRTRSGPAFGLVGRVADPVGCRACAMDLAYAVCVGTGPPHPRRAHGWRV